jgi:hypothetical protein
MLLEAPFKLPPGFLAAFGYPGDRRFVALFWEPCGDEAGFDDGVSFACGSSNNWLYLDFIRRDGVRCWLDQHDLNLGNSDEPAQHWLIVDTETGDLFAAPSGEAGPVVRNQRLPNHEEGTGGP